MVLLLIDPFFWLCIVTSGEQAARRIRGTATSELILRRSIPVTRHSISSPHARPAQRRPLLFSTRPDRLPGSGDDVRLSRFVCLRHVDLADHVPWPSTGSVCIHRHDRHLRLKSRCRRGGRRSLRVARRRHEGRRLRGPDRHRRCPRHHGETGLIDRRPSTSMRLASNPFLAPLLAPAAAASAGPLPRVPTAVGLPLSSMPVRRTRGCARDVAGPCSLCARPRRGPGSLAPAALPLLLHAGREAKRRGALT